MKLNDTTLPQNYSKVLFEEFNYDLAAEHMSKILCTVFTGTSELLNNAVNVNRPAAFVYERIDGSVVAAAILRCIDNGDEAGSKKWSYVWTFYEADIPENALRISIKDPQTHSYFRSVAGDKWGLRFIDASSVITLLTESLEQLLKWLDENAAEDKEVLIEMDAVFQARVCIEDGQKVFALEPKGEIKKLIKNDASIEH